MMAQYVPQKTLEYTTFVKRAVVEALQGAFHNHPDSIVAGTKVALDFTHDRFTLPAVIIKFHESTLPNAGIAHVEYLPAPNNPDPLNPTIYLKYYQRLYRGEIEFQIWGMSAPDRDIVRDALVEVLAMQDVTVGGENFISRFYGFVTTTPYVPDSPYAQWHFPVLNLDIITGGPEDTRIAPWLPEDTLVYTAGYTVPIFGEFYSVTPSSSDAVGLVQEVDVYPYIEGTDLTPDQNPDPGPGWYQFTGWRTGEEWV